MLLDQLDLHVAPVTDGSGEIHVGRLAEIAEILRLDMFHEKERAGPHGFGPEAQRGVEIRRDEGKLHDRTE
ncbi:hypothetical protein D3C85_1176480 [compost metagenome]